MHNLYTYVCMYTCIILSIHTRTKLTMPCCVNRDQAYRKTLEAFWRGLSGNPKMTPRNPQTRPRSELRTSKIWSSILPIRKRRSFCSTLVHVPCSWTILISVASRRGTQSENVSPEVVWAVNLSWWCFSVWFWCGKVKYIFLWYVFNKLKN